MQNARLDEAQMGIKITRRNVNTSVMQLKPPLCRKQRGTLNILMKVKEESEKTGLNLNIQKMKIMAFGPITSWQIDRETNFIFLGSKITADGDSAM